MRSYYVYILASHKHVLYTGITSKLERRSWEHQHEQAPDSFSARYRVHKLVYFERYGNVQHAITREKQIKAWRREKKVALINATNPKWKDLSADGASPTASGHRRRHRRLKQRGRPLARQQTARSG